MSDDALKQEARKAGLQAAITYSRGTDRPWGPAAVIRWAEAFADWIETGEFHQPQSNNNRRDSGGYDDR